MIADHVESGGSRSARTPGPMSVTPATRASGAPAGAPRGSRPALTAGTRGRPGARGPRRRTRRRRSRRAHSGEQARSEPRPRRGRPFRRARRARGRLIAPASQLAEDLHELGGALAEHIVHAGRHFAVALTRQHPVGDHPVQPRAHLSVRCRAEAAATRRPARTGGEVTNDQQRRLVADKIECPGVGRPSAKGGVPVGGSAEWELPPGGRSYQPSSSLTDIWASLPG